MAIFNSPRVQKLQSIVHVNALEISMWLTNSLDITDGMRMWFIYCTVHCSAHTFHISSLNLFFFSRSVSLSSPPFLLPHEIIKRFIGLVNQVGAFVVLYVKNSLSLSLWNPRQAHSLLHRTMKQNELSIKSVWFVSYESTVFFMSHQRLALFSHICVLRRCGQASLNQSILLSLRQTIFVFVVHCERCFRWWGDSQNVLSQLWLYVYAMLYIYIYYVAATLWASIRPL